MITGGDIGFLLGGGASAGTILMVANHFFGKKEVRKIEPQPLVVTGVEKFVVVEQLRSTLKSYSTQQDLNNLELRIGAKITSAFKELDGKRSEDISEIWKSLGEAREDMAAVKADSRTHTAALMRIENMQSTLLNTMRAGGTRAR